jgi:hypothetical protein
VDSQGPLTSAVLVDPVKTGGGASVDLTATVDDSTTGGSDIQSAQYSTNGIDWATMDAQDGSFDSASEAVTATFLSLSSSGVVNVCVRGTDAAGNTGSQACTTLTVDSDGPLTSSVALDPNPADEGAQVTLTASVDDTTTGNSTLTSAEYQVDGSTWSPMQASNGTFDSALEQVTAQFTASQGPTSIEVCVQGSDVFGNTGSAACEQLEINAPEGPSPVYLPIAVRN